MFVYNIYIETHNFILIHLEFHVLSYINYYNNNSKQLKKKINKIIIPTKVTS